MEADIAGFITVGLVVAFIAGQIFKTWRTNAAQKTLREAITRGVTITPEMLVEAEKSPEPGTNDLRNGMVLIALALAIFGFGLIQGSTDAIKGAAGISLFPLFVGIALLLRLRLLRTQGDT
jgi:Na+/glutamate symporter